jgi:hypothetical protein
LHIFVHPYQVAQWQRELKLSADAVSCSCTFMKNSQNTLHAAGTFSESFYIESYWYVKTLIGHKYILNNS